MSNQQQIEVWNSEVGTTWGRNQERLDAMLEPLGIAGIEALGVAAGHRVLDVGCGFGATTLELVRRGATAVGIDVSAPMLRVACKRAEQEDAAISFVEQDAATHSYDGSYDRVFSRFGVMFFDDPAGAFSNLRAALKPDGKLGFVCWRAVVDNAWMWDPIALILKHVPPPPPTDPNAPGPFAFADGQRLRVILEGAGFKDVGIEALDRQMLVGGGTAEDALGLIGEIGPAASLLADQDEEKKRLVRDEMLRLFSQHTGPRGVEMAAACWIVTANAN